MSGLEGVAFAAIARSDLVGIGLLVLTIVAWVFGYLLSRAGMKLDETAAAVAKAVKDAERATQTAKETAAQAQTVIAQSSGEASKEIAANTTQVAETTSAINAQISGLNDALGALTGNQAPARVMWAFGALCLVAALVSFDLVAVSVGTNAGTTSAGG